ncbi:DUF4157 domain-containing protein [Pseudoalteromonas sp. XMcav2-N-2]|uniref:eCIS core domain-containing protein n=1 Tax=Pseudoalteromonas sp. XMcav2-N-2 TaxID=3136666 RepID=UPI0032C44384
MYADKGHRKDNKHKAGANSLAQKKSDVKRGFALVDNRAKIAALGPTSQNSGNPPLQQKQVSNNRTGLPDDLKLGIERMSGYSMDDVRVHYNSDKPAQLQAHAYAQGNDIHIASGQHSHLAHEAWHVVQQKQGRVKPTTQLKSEQGSGVSINTDSALEAEADVMGAKAVQLAHHQIWPTGEGAVQKNTFSGSVLQGAFTYAAAVSLDRANKAQDTRTHDLQVDRIVLPESFRPPTQYGDTQQAHSVSWTLLKRGYTNVKNLGLNDFIDHYLIHDWQALRTQQSHMNPGLGSNAYKELNRYLAIYNNNYFNNLKQDNESSLEIHNKIRRAISDYFVALQLAPLSTHTGYMVDLAGGQLIDHRPVSHGEPAANKKLSKIEDALDQFSMYTVDQKNEVVNKAKAYWDTGVGKSGGINDPGAINIIAQKYETAFARAYPKIWSLYSADIKANVLAPEEAAAQTVVGNSPALANDPAAIKVTDQALATKPVAFHAQVHISDIRAANAQPAKLSVNELAIASIYLPDDRPLTQYGDEGQKSHTVAWTLTLKAITKAGYHANLKSFLLYMEHRWQALAAQDWADITTKDKYGTSGSSKKVNRQRIALLHNLIAPAIQELNTVVGNVQKSELEWTQLLQNTLSQYVEVYASAPLTTYKDGQATGHGEPDANEHLGDLEGNIGGHISTDKWNNKFKSEFVSGQYWNNPTFGGDTDDMQTIYAKLANNTPLSGAEEARKNMILVRQLAQKYLDIKWNAFMKPGSGAVVRAETDMTAVLREWETSFKEAYPNIWRQYRGIVMETVNKYALSESIKARNGTKVDMSAWMEPHHANDGLRDAQNGDTDQNGSNSYNAAKQDYHDGVVSIRGGNQAQDGSAAFNQAKQDYHEGVVSIRGGNQTRDGCAAFNQAKQDYHEGVVSIRGGNQTQDGSAAFNQAKQDYHDGVVSIRGGNQTQDGSAAFNQAKQDYHEGLVSIRGGNQTQDGSAAFNQAKQDYHEGVVSIQGGDHTQNGPSAFNQAKVDFLANIH